MSNPEKTAVVLINLGSPASPKPRDVRRYLNEFLTDPRVIDLPWLRRHFLVRCVIVPKRYKSSAASYEVIWTSEGSPLINYGKKVKSLLQARLGEQYHVALAMRYQQPSISKVLKELEKLQLKSLIFIPMFPQYTSATTGSVHQSVMKELCRWDTFPAIHFIDSYPEEPLMIEAFADNACRYDIASYDHILFSFHGLPLSHNTHKYTTECYATADAICRSLKLDSGRYSICFQSRLGKQPWLQPYASEHLQQLIGQGIKKILVFSPSFVADCLETLHEIKIEYRREFLHAGGEQLDLVESLNTHPNWISALEKLVNSCNVAKKVLS